MRDLEQGDHEQNESMDLEAQTIIYHECTPFCALMIQQSLKSMLQNANPCLLAELMMVLFLLSLIFLFSGSLAALFVLQEVGYSQILVALYVMLVVLLMLNSYIIDTNSFLLKHAKFNSKYSFSQRSSHGEPAFEAFHQSRSSSVFESSRESQSSRGAEFESFHELRSARRFEAYSDISELPLISIWKIRLVVSVLVSGLATTLGPIGWSAAAWNCFVVVVISVCHWGNDQFEDMFERYFQRMAERSGTQYNYGLFSSFNLNKPEEKKTSLEKFNSRSPLRGSKNVKFKLPSPQFVIAEDGDANIPESLSSPPWTYASSLRLYREQMYSPFLDYDFASLQELEDAA